MVEVLYALSVVFFGLTAWCSQTALAEVRSRLPNSFGEDVIRVAADHWVWDRSMPNRARRYTVWEGVWFSLACASAGTGLWGSGHGEGAAVAALLGVYVLLRTVWKQQQFRWQNSQ